MTTVQGWPGNPVPGHPQNPGPLFLATAGGRVTGAIELNSPDVVLSGGAPGLANWAHFGRPNGGPPRIIVSKATNEVRIDVADGQLRDHNAADRVSWSATGTAVNGNAPVAKKAAIASPAADVAALKTAVDAIRVAIRDFGITA
jgi:hypothetical protein